METNTIYDAYWQSGLHVTLWPNVFAERLRAVAIK
jgi:hypothetical protein